LIDRKVNGGNGTGHELRDRVHGLRLSLLHDNLYGVSSILYNHLVNIDKVLQ